MGLLDLYVYIMGWAYDRKRIFVLLLLVSLFSRHSLFAFSPVFVNT